MTCKIRLSSLLQQRISTVKSFVRSKGHISAFSGTYARCKGAIVPRPIFASQQFNVHLYAFSMYNRIHTSSSVLATFLGEDRAPHIIDESEEDESSIDDAEELSDGRDSSGESLRLSTEDKEEEDSKSRKKEERKGVLKAAKRLVAMALDDREENEDASGLIPEHRQRSLRVGIVGAANAGKSTLTNFMVGTKVAAVSRKRNTTLSEILGIMTKGDTQILFYDTPGVVLDILGYPSKNDTRVRSETAWQMTENCEVLVVLIDGYRQIHKPDRRVLRLVERLGKEENPHPKRVLCLNKVDIVEKKPDLLTTAEQFGDLPGYERFFMISGMTGSGVRQLEEYLMDQAVLRPWEEDPDPLNEEVMRNLSLEVVREQILNFVHEEIPYVMEHELTDWTELEDGSLQIQQHLYLPKKGQCRIVVGKGGETIRTIQDAASKELSQITGRNVQLALAVKHRV